jgi:hypothetical protein
MRVLLGVLLAAAAWAQVLDRVAVVVGNTVLTETEVVQETRLEAFMNQAPLKLDAETKRTAADRLVDQKLIRNEMKIGAYPQPTPAEVDGMLGNLKQERFGGSDTAYRAALEKYGITEAQVREYLAWQLAAIRFTDLRFTPAIPGNGDEQSANRSSNGVPDVDQQLDAWLKQTRAETKVRFKQGAFQ